MEQNDNEKTTAEVKALNLFSEMMIAKIESLSKKDGWKKPWFTEGALQWPQNINGRDYNGMNAAMLLFLCEKNGYKIPRFCTFERIQQFNNTSKKGEEKKPRVKVNKGEHSFPVMLTTFTVVDKETKEHIKWEDYKQLSQEQREKYNVYPKLQTYYVFNVEQTNLKETRPELWEKLEQEYSMPKVDKSNDFSFEPVDRMIADNRWICPIKPTYGDHAYFSISKNEIVIPEKSQFKDGESFYSNLFHEMGHSTGAENQLDRIKPTTFGSAEYGREELVAELTAALTAQRYGMSKNLKDDSAAYLKSWLDKLKESPQFIKTVLFDVKKASSILTQRIDQIVLEIEEEKKEEQTETIAKKEGKDTKGLAADTASTGAEQVYYSSVAYLQSTDDTSELDKLKEKGDYQGLLTAAKEYYNGDAIDEEHTYKSPYQNRGDDLLIEDKDFAVVYNGSVGGTYEIFTKHTEQEVRDHINRYGLGQASRDVMAAASEMHANISSAYDQLLDMEEYKEEHANDVGQHEQFVAKSAFRL